MDESGAWLFQANSDREAAERFTLDGRIPVPCHAIATWQQAVEKSIKSLVAALGDVGVVSMPIGYKHEVSKFVRALVQLPRQNQNREIQNHLHRLLDADTRAGIGDLEQLVPKRPAPGNLPGRNTEYPFLDENQEWTYPAADGSFSQIEIEWFRKLAHRVVARSERIVSVIRRALT